jgi:hypothetical protein
MRKTRRSNTASKHTDHPLDLSILISFLVHVVSLQDDPISHTVNDYSDASQKWRERAEARLNNLGQLGRFDDLVLRLTANTLDDFRGWIRLVRQSQEGNWIYRGQGSSKWMLEPSMVRATTVKTESSTPGRPPELVEIDPKWHQDALLDLFKRHAHQYSTFVPADGDTVGWLALMQHHGAPTGLLDWTFSPYVALFFAVEKRVDSASSHSVWAISAEWVQTRCTELLAKASPVSEAEAQSDPVKRRLMVAELIRNEGAVTEPLVVLAEPERANPRETAQQGAYVVRLSHRYSMELALLNMMMKPSFISEPVVWKLDVTPSARIGILRELREMNITRASLFPGLEGYCQALAGEIEYSVDEMSSRIRL